MTRKKHESTAAISGSSTTRISAGPQSSQRTQRQKTSNETRQRITTANSVATHLSTEHSPINMVQTPSSGDCLAKHKRPVKHESQVILGLAFRKISSSPRRSLRTSNPYKPIIKEDLKPTFSMKLEFTPKQLNADLLAGVLNQAFINSDVVKKDQGINYATFSMNGLVCEISAVGNTLQLSQTIRVTNETPKEAMLRIVEYINRNIMHSKYAGTCNDGSHLISHHYAHWIPEDETITPAYIVKLARSFAGFQEKHLKQWASNAQKALR